MKRQQKIITSAVLAVLAAWSVGVSAASLPDVIKQTLATNPNVQASVSEQRARTQELKQARSGYYPSVDITAAIGQENSDNYYTRNFVGPGYIDLTRRESAINVRQNLFNGFQTSSAVQRAQARVGAASYDVIDTAENTALRATEVYIDVLRRQRLFQLAQQFVEKHERIYQQIKSRARAGVSRTADLDQAEGRLALARANLVAAENNLHDAQANYQRVVGHFPTGAMQSPPVLDDAIPATQEAAVNEAMANNPALKAATAEVSAAEAQRREAGNAFYPHFDLVFSQSYNKNLDGLEGTNKDYSAMLRMRYNLFNGGGDIARRHQAAQLLSQSKDLQNRERRQVVERVRMAWNNLRTAKGQLGFLKQHVDASAKTRDAYAKQFSIGQRTLLDLLDTENELFEARRAYVNGQLDRIYAEYRLLAATGKLLGELKIAAQ
ncbi:MAG: TolC family outer membrane protein [Gammaproteobacteria bacterium]